MAEKPLHYKVLFKKDNIEIRHYQYALIATVSSPGDLFSGRNNNFSKLANYIFGRNDHKENIGMTSPVIMNTSADSMEMHFVMPERFTMANLPNPLNNDIRIQELDSFHAIARTFGGYANPSKYDAYVKEVISFAEENGLKHTGEFLLLGYDPPFRMINRKNEILLKLTEKPDMA